MNIENKLLESIFEILGGTEYANESREFFKNVNIEIDYVGNFIDFTVEGEKFRFFIKKI